MTNTEIIQAIRKEIISRIDKRHLSAQAENELVSILSFISDLEQSEKPVPADLEEAAKEYALNTAEDSEQYSARYLGYKDGAKCQKEQDDKELSEKIAAAYQLGVKDKEQMMKDAVKWLVDDDYDELTDKGGFSLGSVGIGYNGYYIPYSDLLKLPKED